MSQAASPEEEARVVSAIKTALEKKDAKALLELYCWDGVTDQFKQGTAKQTEKSVPKLPTVKEVTLTTPTPDQVSETHFGGVTYRANLPITKVAEVSFAEEGPNKHLTMKMPLGEKDGKLFITAPTPVK